MGRSARSEDEQCLSDNLRSVFSELNTTRISKVEFMERVDNPVMAELFKSMHIDSGEAHALFYALDMDDEGVINLEEFVYGCLRLRGSAKAIDMFTLTKDVQTLHKILHRIVEHI